MEPVVGPGSSLICNGRSCRHCGSPICRPENFSQSGMHAAVVCDACWEQAGLSYAAGLIGQKALARELGVSFITVRAHLARWGLISDVSLRAWQRRQYTKRDPQQNREKVCAWNRTERGRKQHREYMHEYWQRPEVKEHRREYRRKKRESSQNGVNES